MFWYTTDCVMSKIKLNGGKHVTVTETFSVYNKKAVKCAVTPISL